MSTLKVVVLLLAAFLGTSYAEKCTAICPRSLPTSIVPKVQSTYVYGLEAKTVLTPRDTLKVTVKADAEVAIENVCEATLRLKNVVIEGVPNGAELAGKVATNPIGFGYHNGKVRGVCPTKDEEEWATNIKKAVISALQVSFTGEASFSSDVEEEDFAGKCTASFTRLEQGAQGTVLQKKKDLNRCSERRVDLRQTPDQALGQFKELLRQHLHPVDSQQSCRITLKDQVVKEVECEETHSLLHRHEKPITTASLKLTLKSSKDGIASDFAAREVLQQPNLYLTHQHKTVHTATEADVVAKLKELCAQVSDKTSSLEASTAFNELVDLLKYLPADAAASVDAAVKAGSAICPAVPKRLRELFLDASAFAASDSAIKTLVRAHNAKELTITRAAAAFTVVALKAQPNEETVRALLPLIDSDSTTRPLLLGFSVLIRRYCEKTNDCATNAAIAEARDVYANRIAKTTDKLVKVTLIKALENLNVNPTGGEKAVKQLEEIINSAEAGDAARLAAVKALPTTAGAAGQLKSIVLNEALPNEVRIAAFQKLAASGAGLKDAGQLLAVQEHCVKNYIGTYVKNLRASKNPVRRSLVPDTVELKEEPNTKFGISKNIAYEYGPLTVDVDVVYPKNSNVTQSISARISKISNDKVVTIAELSVRQEGLDKQVGNVLNAISRKITPSQFGFELVKDLSALVQKLKQKDHTHNHLQLAAQVNGKNILFTDAFEDLHTLVDLLRKRIEKVIDEKKVDRTIGGVLIDTKVVVPTVSGIPLVYKLTDNFVIQINGEVSKDGSKSRVILNRSLIAGIRASVKLLLKDQKLGFEYNGKLALTPNIDVEAEKKEKGVQIKLNLKEDRKTLLKFKQSLREIKQAGTDVTSENELAPEPRSDNCVSVLILNYCRKATQVKGLKIPNVEYYLTKPEAGINAIVLDLVTDNADPTAKKYTIKISALGGSKSYEHLAQLEFLTPAGGAKEMKLLLKSPENSLDTKFSINVGSSTVNVKLNLPNVIDIDVTNTMTENAEKNGGTSNMLIEYKFPEDPTKHSIKWNSKAMANLKRTGKDKVANFEYGISFESSRRPSLNHRFLVDFKYRPYKLNEVKLEFAYGKDMANLYKFARTSKIDVQEFRPFKLSSESETEIVATDFDVDYHLKADTKLLNDKGNALEFDLNLKGKDRSKRAAGKDNEITGKVMYRNKGATVDSKLEASLKGLGRDYGWNSELKQVEPHKYEGKITVQLDKDRKVFITHKEEASKPTKDFSLKSEADITYSFKPDKKSYKLEVKKVGTAINLKGEATKDGKVILSNDVNFESSNGKLKALLTRDTRSYDLTVDNVYKPKDAALIFKIEDRVYNIKLNREPMKYINLKVDGNDKALIKSGTAHLSIIDASKLNLVTKANTKIDTSLDLLSTVTKKASLKVDSPKFNFKHEGDIELNLVNRRLNWKSYTKKDTREYKFNADIARKGSAISLQKIVPERTSSVQYSRNGEKIEINIDTEYLQGKVEGDRRAGKIVLKNKDKNYSLESTYKLENRKLVIESVSSNNAKLEAVISRIAPSKLVLETPNTKANVALDLSAPVKTFKLDFDNPKYSKKITAESEPGKRFKYSSYGKIKEGNREQKIEVNGKPLKELNVDIQFPDFKLKVEQPEASKKVKFSYTFNNYTEDEEFDFDPNKAYFANWISAIRHYAQTFLVQTA